MQISGFKLPATSYKLPSSPMLLNVQEQTADSATPVPPPPSSKRRGLGRAAPVAAFALVLPISGSLAVLAVGLPLAHWLRDVPGGVFVFTISFAILGALALAPTYSTSLIAGWTFGFALGFPAVVIGTVGGATLCYVFARKFAA